MSNRLLGLVLAGGQSRRMGRDKAFVEITPGVPLVVHVVAALRRTFRDVVVSLAEPGDASQCIEGSVHVGDEQHQARLPRAAAISVATPASVSTRLRERSAAAATGPPIAPSAQAA